MCERGTCRTRLSRRIIGHGAARGGWAVHGILCSDCWADSVRLGQATGGRWVAGRLPRVTPEQVLRALRRDGWLIDEQEGAHIALRHTGKPGYVTVPTTAAGDSSSDAD